jgi:F0F1-type ATP synthase assembly protein I
MKKPRERSWIVQVAEYSNLVFIPPAGALVGYGIGYLLDRSFGTTFLKIVFLLLGIAAAFYDVLRKLLKDTRDS